MTTADQLTILFGVGLGVFAAATLVFLLWGTFMWALRRAENPSHLLVWSCAVYTVVYAVLLVDGTAVLRTGDGVEYPWIRSAGNALIYVMLANMTATALWMSWADMWLSLGLAAAGGVAFGLTDAASTPNAWWWFGAGLLTQLLQTALSLRRSRRVGNRAWLLLLGSLVWTLGMPVGQALSWTLGGAVSSSPHRLGSEILFIVLAGVGILLYGAVAMVLWRPVPLPPASAELLASAETLPSPEPLPLKAEMAGQQVAMATNLRHRNVHGWR